MGHDNKAGVALVVISNTVVWFVWFFHLILMFFWGGGWVWIEVLRGPGVELGIWNSGWIGLNFESKMGWNLSFSCDAWVDEGCRGESNTGKKFYWFGMEWENWVMPSVGIVIFDSVTNNIITHRDALVASCVRQLWGILLKNCLVSVCTVIEGFLLLQTCYYVPKNLIFYFSLIKQGKNT